MQDRDPIAEQECPSCGAILAYHGHIDGGTPDGTRLNVVLWRCGNCGGRYSARTDLRDAAALARVVPEPWPYSHWPG